MRYFIFLIPFFISCTPIKSTPEDAKHKLELTLHEVQTNVDDMRHDLNCFKTQMQIVDNKIDLQEKNLISVKDQIVKQNISKVNLLALKIKTLEEKLENGNLKKEVFDDIKRLSEYAKETTLILTQYKNKIEELESIILAQNKKLEKFNELKKTLKTVAASLKNGAVVYKVKAEDTLGSIAIEFGTTVEKIKKLNKLKEDLIIIGQELKIPN